MNDKSNAQLPERSNLPHAGVWDLEIVYRSAHAWEKEFESLRPCLSRFVCFRNCLTESPDILKQAIEAKDNLERLAEKVYVYAHLKSDEDTSNSEHRSRLERIRGLMAEISGESAWFEPELLAADPEIMDRFIAAPELTLYKRGLTELLRFRPHALSASEERILGMASDVMATPHKVFSVLNDADLRFPSVPDGNGKKIELTHGNYLKFMENPDREIRRAVFGAMYDTYECFSNTFSTMLDGEIKQHVLLAKLRDYPSALNAALFDDHISGAVYHNLIHTVHEKISALHEYMALRAEVMNLQKIDMYDLFQPLVPESRMEVDWPLAAKWVKAALQPLGEDYCAKAEKAFAERWIDVYECRGKRSGAYSSGSYDTSPYILMNFHGTLNDVFTLAHELGHSLHSYYSHQAQPYHYADYSIFVAEVASITNELLLHDYLMRHADSENLKSHLLGHLADEIRGTLFRQTQFAEFELEIHRLVENSVPLSPDLLNKNYYKLNSQYYGEAVVADQRIAMEWARIPHFYYNFYVYKYATGFAAAVQLSKNLLHGSQDLRDAYFGFLKAGSSKDVLDIMKDAGVDLSTPEPICAALELFQRTVRQLRSRIIRD